MHTYIYLYSCMYNENNKQAKTKTTKKKSNVKHSQSIALGEGRTRRRLGTR